MYRVKRIEKYDNFHEIHLEYGAIFNLMKKDKNYLTEEEEEVLINYQYCSENSDKIQNRGDAYMKCNRFEEAEKYFLKKIDFYEQTKNK